MIPITVYMDNCSFNRPYDDQLQHIIRLETEAKLLIQQDILKGKIGLVWSFVSHYENNDNPYAERKNQIGIWEGKARKIVTFDESILEKAKEIMALGVKNKDALHVACAINGKADFFVTTDKKLLNKSIEGIVLINPIDLVRRYFE